jgi:hypothetical protein
MTCEILKRRFSLKLRYRLAALAPVFQTLNSGRLGRTLKTDVSARAVPLVGLGLWGCRRALANPSGKDGWLFGYGGTTYPATQPLADWLMKVIPGTPKRSHSFRKVKQDEMN